MKKLGVIFILWGVICLNAIAFYNVNNFSALASGYNATPSGNYSNWSPMPTAVRYVPMNDTRNINRFAYQPRSFQNNRQDSNFESINSNPLTTPKIEPSNWLKETDFSKTLRPIERSNNKTFFANEASLDIKKTYQNKQEQAIEHKKPLRYFDTLKQFHNKQAN